LDLVKNDGLAFYPDWPAAGYYDVLVANIQDLLSGKKAIDKTLDALASGYENR